MPIWSTREKVGIVFNGEPNKASEEFIIHFSKLPVLFRLAILSDLSPEKIRQVANQINI
jgi:hypothetical protein